MQCVVCRGGKMLCGEKVCPIYREVSTFIDSKVGIKRDLKGSAPSVFIGRFGYPNVNIGPLVPPLIGDTAIYDRPALWNDLEIPDILNYRTSLFRPIKKTQIKAARDPTRFVQDIQEIAMAKKPVDTEVLFKGAVKYSIKLDSLFPPVGPRADILKLDVENPKISKGVEKVYYDTDLKSKDALSYLHSKDFDVYSLSKIMSAGVVGLKNNKKLVPTRWAITATDSIIGDSLVEEIKNFPTIDKYTVFYSRRFGNTFLVLLLPRPWSYELAEILLPKSVWLKYGTRTEIISDHEGYFGRTTYAKNSGGYYAAKVAALEYLKMIKRQASCLIIREVTEDYWVPLGVWLVRELVKESFERQHIFEDLDTAMGFISSRIRTPMRHWKNESHILNEQFHQKTLLEFL